MKRRTAAAILIAMMFVQPAAADRLDDIKARGKLMVGVSDTTPPFSFKRSGESTVVGYDLDVVHAVAKRLGCQWRPFRFRAPSASRC